MEYNDAKYYWVFRQTVGRTYIGSPIYHKYSFETLFEMLRAIIYFKYKFIQRICRNGWKGRWWA